jgi:hypothetical protein
MRSSRLFFALLLAILLIHAAAATAATTIDMDDPRRVVGREDDVRIDAQLVQETVSPGAPVGITYQIQNFTAAPVAIASKVTTASYDVETRTITLAVGAEVPADGNMPLIVVIAPGEKKVFRTGATPSYGAAALRASGSLPRFVQVKVSILRDVTPFAAARSGEKLTDAQFDQWFESNDTIFLNTVPVSYSPRRSNLFEASADASRY